jgi:hypothetical protein
VPRLEELHADGLPGQVRLIRGRAPIIESRFPTADIMIGHGVYIARRRWASPNVGESHFQLATDTRALSAWWRHPSRQWMPPPVALGGLLCDCASDVSCVVPAPGRPKLVTSAVEADPPSGRTSSACFGLQEYRCCPGLGPYLAVRVWKEVNEVLLETALAAVCCRRSRPHAVVGVTIDSADVEVRAT